MPEFNPDSLVDEASNTEKRWTQWLENFDCCLEFEGVTDPATGASKKRAALLAIGGQQLRDLFKTLKPTDDTYTSACTILNDHFKAKKNLTAERFKFFYTKPRGPEESHDHWISRLRTLVKDCDFDKMDDDEAIKLVVTLHTTSEKLQTAIIQKDMNLEKVISTAKSMEMAQRELTFMKNNRSLESPALDAIKQGKWNERNNERHNTYNDNHSSRRKQRTIQLCRYCGERVPHMGQCKARNATCNSCSKRGHFAKVCESRPHNKKNEGNTDNVEIKDQQHPSPPSTTVTIDKVTTSRQPSHAYPDVYTSILINNHPIRMKIDSGAEAKIITEDTFNILRPKPTLRNQPHNRGR